MNDQDALLARIRKLLAKAEDPAVTPAEAEALNTKAAGLIAKYGVEAALLAADKPGTDEVGDKVVILDPPYARDKADLLWAVALPLRCEGILRTRWDQDGRRVLSMHLFGFGADLERAELLFTSLLVQSAHGLAAERVPRWERPAAYRRAWLAGFTAAVERRLAAAEDRARRQAEPGPGPGGGPSVALVLADRSALVKRAAEGAYPKARPERARNLSGSGHLNGWNAGLRADLDGTRIGRPTRAPIEGPEAGPAPERGGSGPEVI